jgi:hypothetical protein
MIHGVSGSGQGRWSAGGSVPASATAAAIVVTAPRTPRRAFPAFCRPSVLGMGELDGFVCRIRAERLAGCRIVVSERRRRSGGATCPTIWISTSRTSTGWPTPRRTVIPRRTVPAAPRRHRPSWPAGAPAADVPGEQERLSGPGLHIRVFPAFSLVMKFLHVSVVITLHPGCRRGRTRHRKAWPGDRSAACAWHPGRGSAIPFR